MFNGPKKGPFFIALGFMAEAWLQKVEEIAAKVAEAEGCVLYDIEFTGIGKGRTLCVYIDKTEGIGIDECSRVSQGLDAAIADDLIPGEAYNLEVSSPGLDRKLTKAWHYSAAVGKKISLKTLKPLEEAGIEEKRWKAAKTVEGVISQADEQSVYVKVKEGDLKIPIAMIEKAKLVFEMTKGQKK